MTEASDNRDRPVPDDEVGNPCFLVEVAGQQIGYFRHRENAEAAVAALVIIHELHPTDWIACEDDDEAASS